MKVLCVSNTYVGLSITIGKWYEIYRGELKLSNLDILLDQYKNGSVIVKDDKGRWTRLSNIYFKTIEDIREEKLKEIGI